MTAKLKQICLVSVSNDIVGDNRVHRTCSALIDLGYEPVLIGRLLPKSQKLIPRFYECKRLRLLFKKNAVFYAELQFRLFFFLLFRHADLLFANDLDTLWPNYWVSKLKKIPLVYDSHECFTEVPELNDNPRAKAVWMKLEARILPKLPAMITVCQSIADYYHQRYQIPVSVVKNVPILKPSKKPAAPADWPIDASQTALIYQGTLNVDRGIEETILALKFLPNWRFLIFGEGPMRSQLKALIEQENLSQRVFLMGQKPAQVLWTYTAQADLGISLEKDVSLSYHYCLPNKLFDYIQARIPVLVAPLPEMKRILDTYQIGMVVDHVSPQEIAKCLSNFRDFTVVPSQFEIAAADLCWENEQGHLARAITRIVTDHETDKSSKKRPNL